DQRFVGGKGRGVALVAQQLHEQSPNLASQIRHCRRYLQPGKRFARKRKWSRVGVVLAVESKTCSRQKNKTTPNDGQRWSRIHPAVCGIFRRSLIWETAIPRPSTSVENAYTR